MRADEPKKEQMNEWTPVCTQPGGVTGGLGEGKAQLSAVAGLQSVISSKKNKKR